MHIGETGGGEINRAFPMLNSAIDEKYEMERVWNTGGKNWRYEYKYRRACFSETIVCLHRQR